MTTPRMPRWLRRTLTVATAGIALGAMPLVASAAPSVLDTAGYNCGSGQLTTSVLTAQTCTAFGGAPTSGLVITGNFQVNVLLLNGTLGILSCTPPVDAAQVSGVVVPGNGGVVTLVGLNCQRLV